MKAPPDNKGFALWIIACALLIPLTRLPQLLGGHLVPDGDECILGLMAVHLLEGRGVPVFFYGQRYGFSLVEGGAAALFFSLSGVSALSLKAAMLFLWSAGWFFWVQGARRFWGKPAAMGTACLLVLMPAWAAWSMKARGGYLTAFAASGCLLWLLAVQAEAGGKGPAARIRWLAVGLLTGLTVVSQPIWLLAAAPVVFMVWLRTKSPAGLLLTLIGAVSFVALTYGIPAGPHSAYWSPALFKDPDLIQALERMPDRVLGLFEGAYWLDRRAHLGAWTRICAWLWSVVLLGVLFQAAVGAAFSARRSAPYLSLALGVLAVLVLPLVMNHQLFGYRYLLPAAGSVAVLVSAALLRAPDTEPRLRLPGILLLAAMILTGLGSMWEFRGLSFDGPAREDGWSEKAALQALIDALSAKGVGHVYCLDPTLQWNITFASRERIKARWLLPNDRFPPYPRAVDDALKGGEPVAVVGKISQVDLLGRLGGAFEAADRREVIVDRYFVVFHPPPSMIRALGFRLNP